MHNRIMRPALFALAVVFGLTACGPTPKPPTAANIKIGKPYVIDGKTYYPSYDPTYDKIGEGSWYGPGFHGKYTANGEVFNQNDLTAAHPTLPMPSLVRVTNLQNGKSVIVRINDRGPFAKNRIIDLSKKSAQTIGMHSTSKVRVQFLKDETEQYVANLQAKGKPINMAEYNAKAEDIKEDSITEATAPASQIVESTVTTTHVGQTVSSAAPVMTVSSDNLPKPKIIKSAEATEIPEPLPDDKQAGPEPVVIHNAIESERLTPPKAANIAPSAGSKYVIQAGSFASEVNARKLETKLAEIANVFVDRVDMGDKSWWRVRVGQFANKAEAALALDKVRAAGIADARIIQ